MDAGERVHDRGVSSSSFIRGATGAEVPFYKSMIGNCMVYHDRIESNLLQIFAHPETLGFLQFLLLFLGSTSLLNRNKHSW